MLFDDRLRSATEGHVRVSGVYTAVKTLNSFLAALAFVVGSVLFYWESLFTTATTCFVVGSVLFAVNPVIELRRTFHLRRLDDGHVGLDVTGS